MLKIALIVGTASATLLMTGCGQKGALTLPQEPAAQNRATLPQVLSPTIPLNASPTLTPAASPASAPKR